MQEPKKQTFYKNLKSSILNMGDLQLYPMYCIDEINIHNR